MEQYFIVAKFFHVAIAILWVGAASGIFIIGSRAIKADSNDEVMVIVRHTKFLAEKIFMPGSILMLFLGLCLVWTNNEGFTFTTAWVDIGILGVVATASIGIFILTPLVNKVAEASSVEEAQVPARALLLKGRADMVLLWTVIFDMVMKPQWSNPIEIVAMAAVVLAGWVYFVLMSREAAPVAAS